MKHLRLFEETSQYEASKDSLEYPTLSCTKNDDKLWYMEKPQPLYEWVDLGLPSGLKWAAWNVGATKPEESGLYFQWGETQGYTGVTDEKQFSWADYTLCDGTQNNMTKYNATDGLTNLEAADDAATATDSSCRMPTVGECYELISNTTSVWDNDYNGTGVLGRIFTSKVNDNSIFIPAAGFCLDGSAKWVGQDGDLWSSSLASFDVKLASILGLHANGTNVITSNCYRYWGLPIRAVKE
jgi:hypothetical protein